MNGIRGSLLCVALLLLGGGAGSLQAQSDDRAWRLSLQGGAAFVDDGDGQPFVGIGLEHAWDDAHAQIELLLVGAADAPGLAEAVPARSRQLRVAAGHRFGDWSLEAQARIGRRIFEPERFRGPGRIVESRADGKSFGLGASLTRDIALGGDVYLSPFASIDYDRLDIGRAVETAAGERVVLRESEEGLTGSAGASVQHLFGRRRAHATGIYAVFVASSNSTAYDPGAAPGEPDRLTARRDIPGFEDSWIELGGFASVALGGGMALDLGLLRSFGFAGSDATTASAGLSFAF